jgi:hypothetical protein
MKVHSDYDYGWSKLIAIKIANETFNNIGREAAKC